MRTTVRETSVSRHHKDPNKDTPETPQTSHHCGNEWYKRRRSSIKSHYAYNRSVSISSLCQSQTGKLRLPGVVVIHSVIKFQPDVISMPNGIRSLIRRRAKQIPGTNIVFFMSFTACYE